MRHDKHIKKSLLKKGKVWYTFTHYTRLSRKLRVKFFTKFNGGRVILVSTDCYIAVKKQLRCPLFEVDESFFSTLFTAHIK